MIQLERVSKRFGAYWALDNLSLRVPSGEIFGLLGHNGAGKSTAIGITLGQVWPTTGQITVAGFDIARQRSKALRRVGALFETPAFYDYLSGWRNLEMLSHYSAPTPSARIREVVQWVGLQGREQSKVKTYSHGMRARLALAQALLPGPDLLILDEPSEGLDPEGIHEMRQTILRLHRELGLTILLSSHLLSEVEQICSRIAVLQRGHKVFEGTLAEIKRAQDWVRLQTNDFGRAVSCLAQQGLIRETRAPHYLALAESVNTAQVTACLVHHGLAVYEIAREAQTLETFYLNLVQGTGAMDTPVTP